jgi:hypothetical protein
VKKCRLKRWGILIRKKNIKISRAALICVTVAVALNVIGVGYASWNDSVSISSAISTGRIDVAFCNVHFNNNPNGDKKDTGNKKYNDINLDLDPNTILIKGKMYYANDIVLKYDVENNSTIPVDMCNVSNKKYKFENNGFVIINSGIIKIHIPKVDGNYEVTVPMEFESKFGSWKKTLYIKLDINVELDKNKCNVQDAESTAPSALSAETLSETPVDNIEANAESVEESDNNVETVDIVGNTGELKEDTQTQIEKISESLENLSDAIVVESKSDNLVEPVGNIEANVESIVENDNNVETVEIKDNTEELKEDNQIEIEKINEVLDKMSDAIIVESRSND